MWNLKYGTNGPVYRAETDHCQGEQTFGCGGGVGGWKGSGMDGEFGVGGCKLLHLEWMGNGVLLYSTANYVLLDHFAVQQK